MAKYKIIQERDACIGCSAFEAIAPLSWEMENDGKSSLKGAKKQSSEVFVLETDELGENMHAAESCPVNCIHVEENGKRKI